MNNEGCTCEFSQFLFINELYIAECCESIKVIGGGGAKEKHPSIFTTYTKEPNLINGYVHYTSLNGGKALTVDTNGNWILQDASYR